MDPKHRVYYYVSLGGWPNYEKNLAAIRNGVASLKMRPLPWYPPVAREWRAEDILNLPGWQMMFSCYHHDEDAMVEMFYLLPGVRFEKREE